MTINSGIDDLLDDLSDYDIETARFIKKIADHYYLKGYRAGSGASFSSVDMGEDDDLL